MSLIITAITHIHSHNYARKVLFFFETLSDAQL